MMDDLLKAMLSGEGSQAGGGQPEENPLADLLGGMLGGGATPGASGSEDLLQGLLGGPQGAGGTDDLLGAVLGGGGAETGSQASLAPMANAIAEKLGLPPEIAQAVVAFVLGRLLSGGGQTTATPPTASSGRRRKSKPPRPQNLDLGGLLNQARSGQSIEPSHVRASGIHEELARQTGLDADTAARSLEEVLNLLGAQPGQSPGSRAGGVTDDAA
jgi:hypothetical protein